MAKSQARKIVSAAISYKDDMGKEFIKTGSSHGIIKAEIEKDFINNPEKRKSFSNILFINGNIVILQKGKLVDGFVTKNGKFFNRKKATALAKKNGQISDGVDELQSYMIN